VRDNLLWAISYAALIHPQRPPELNDPFEKVSELRKFLFYVWGIEIKDLGKIAILLSILVHLRDELRIGGFKIGHSGITFDQLIEDYQKTIDPCPIPGKAIIF
jgi:hypothetical protein